MTNVKDYLIWPDHPGEIGLSTFEGHLIIGCDRAGGDYVISLDEADWIRSPRGVKLRGEDLNGLRTRLTTLLVDQRRHGVSNPIVTRELVERAFQKRPLSIHERADRLLRFIAEQTTTIGKGYNTNQNNLAAYAWSESVDEEEVGYLIDYLMKTGLLDKITNAATIQIGNYTVPKVVIVTVEGHTQIEQQESNTDSSQAFVAMWFDESMAEAYSQGIEPAIRDSGYKPLRIDQEEHINKIEDEVIAGIRRSRFLVADFTQQGENARGSVYYEAGFAYGLRLPVIFTCHKDSFNNLHFDTSHFNHIEWTTHQELREKLRNRILAVIGAWSRTRSS